MISKVSIVLLCALFLLVVCSTKKCKLTRKTVWSKFHLFCEKIQDECPLKKKYPGVGGISSVQFKFGCPEPQVLKKWIRQNKNVLYTNTKFVFDACSCAEVCSVPYVECLACKVSSPERASNVWTVLGYLLGGAGIAGVSWVVCKVAIKYRQRPTAELPHFGFQNDQEDDEPSSSLPTDHDSSPSDNATEIKVVDERPRDEKGRFVKITNTE